DGLFVVNAVMPKEESVADTKRVDPRWDREEILGPMVQRDRELRPPASDRRFRPTQRTELAPFDVHLDKIDAWQIVADNGFVDGGHGHGARDDASAGVNHSILG